MSLNELRDHSEAERPAAQRHAEGKRAQMLLNKNGAHDGVLREGCLVKLASADKRFDGQVGRVVETNIKFEQMGDANLVSVLLAPKGSAQGVWVAVPPDCLTVQ